MTCLPDHYDYAIGLYLVLMAIFTMACVADVFWRASRDRRVKELEKKLEASRRLQRFYAAGTHPPEAQTPEARRGRR